MSWRIWVVLVALVSCCIGCSGGDQALAPEDSMEGALKDAQKNAEPMEGSGKGSMKSKSDMPPPSDK
jgi:hypothetical protein